jgi:hypothetical protein
VLWKLYDYRNRTFVVRDPRARLLGPEMVVSIEARFVPPMLGSLSDAAQVLNFDTVTRDLERALASAKTDPEDAVTAACSTVECVCRSILIELGLGLPEKKDIKGPVIAAV